ncbi:tetratricopeptide repeat protein [Solwaraspora sp. WMMD406]|uniref:tetratricopeptide repeat protein n=1 Tax=Solwaraspora sp. WMMD406 TaxID=3016095 RepID=UPI002417ABEB|nr:tetratricopeptide repeat protein [Solwaraspora sp. WMMD406]MDG4763765.1 tetratricopeptide repeat protein [Solwaraspora sp. WMMD406]
MVLVPAVVATAAVWALVADDKPAWTVVAGVAAAVAGAFAPSVLDRVRQGRERREQRNRVVGGALVAELPESVAWLLHPQAAVVGFVGRGWLLTALDRWCADPGASAVRLLVGAGGVGKTRLAQHFARRSTGWQWWPVAPDREETVAERLEAGDRPGRVLLTVDYAETRDPAKLAHLMCAAQRAGGVRVLLLARSVGLWWSSLSAAYPPQAHLVDALTVSANVLEVPAEIEGHSPQQMVTDAVTAFAGRLGRHHPGEVAVAEAGPDVPVLRLHAQALLAVLGGPRGDDRYDVLGEVLGHEARYWRHRARRDGLPGVGEPATDAVLRRLVAVAALLGADDRAQAVDLVRRVPGLGEAPPELVDSYVSWLFALYPSAATGGGLGTLQPDLLAEDLAVAVLRESSPSERAAIVRGLAVNQAVRALTVLSRAHAHQSDAAQMIDVALAADVPVMTEAVLQVGLQFPGVLAPRLAILLGTAELDADWIRRIELRVPYPSIEFGRVALALTTQALRGAAATIESSDRASLLTVHSVRLAEVGRRAEALTAGEEAVNLYRELAATDRDTHLPDLAGSVNNHALWLAEAGRRTEALTTSEEAVNLRRELTATNRDAHLPHLAMSLNNHADLLAEVGRRAEALTTSQEAVNLYRELTATNRDAHLPHLAMSLNNHAIRLAEAGQRTEALTASQEAVNLRRELTATNRDAHLPHLAMSLNNHALRLAEAGQRTEALTTSQEAVNLYRELTATNRDAHLPHLAMSLNNHALRLAEAGQRTEALTTSQEALTLDRELATTNRDTHLPGLAVSLNNHALRLAEAGQRTEALTTSQEALTLYRELATTNRDAYLPDLARSLWSIGYIAHLLGEAQEQIFDAVAEGVRYFDELVAAEPQAFTTDRDAAAATLAELKEIAASQRPKPPSPRSPQADEAAPDAV